MTAEEKAYLKVHRHLAEEYFVFLQFFWQYQRLLSRQDGHEGQYIYLKIS